MPITFTKFILSILQSVESQVCEVTWIDIKSKFEIVLPNPITGGSQMFKDSLGWLP